MGGGEERKLVYMALFIACGVIALSASPVAGAWSFIQVSLMIELTFWLSAHRSNESKSDFDCDRW